jgi:mono/diheme cytochrome c family protein
MRPSFVALATLLAFTDSTSTFAADAARGERLASRWCAACHVVAANQRQASADAPSFAALASQRDFNARRLAFLLLSPHPVMPELALRRSEAEDIVAYIGTLRPARSAPRTAPR